MEPKRLAELIAKGAHLYHGSPSQSWPWAINLLVNGLAEVEIAIPEGEETAWIAEFYTELSKKLSGGEGLDMDEDFKFDGIGVKD